MNVTKIVRRTEIVQTTLNRKMLDNYAKKLIPHASYSMKTIYRDWQATCFSKVYVFETGDKPFYIVHEFARIIRVHMLDQNKIIPEIEGHLNETIPAYYGDEYFFFEISPF